MTSELIIRLARSAERDALEALQRRASLAWDDYREALLANPDAIALPIERISDGRATVAERQGGLAGFSVALPRPDGDAELDGLFVEPTAWRCGIGTKLLGEAERSAARAGAMFLWVVAASNAEGLYAKCGFERIGESGTPLREGRLDAQGACTVEVIRRAMMLRVQPCRPSAP